MAKREIRAGASVVTSPRRITQPKGPTDTMFFPSRPGWGSMAFPTRTGDWMHHYWRMLRGFTLIELLVVLTIVALLLTIAAPEFLSNVNKAKEAVLKEDLFVLR